MEISDTVCIYFRHPTATGGKWEKRVEMQLHTDGAEQAMQEVSEAAWALKTESGIAPDIAMLPAGMNAPDDDVVIEEGGVPTIVVRPGVREAESDE